jgi:hypothetical protein
VDTEPLPVARRRLAVVAVALAALVLCSSALSTGGARGSRTNPYPLKTWAKLPGGFELRVNRSIPNATELVLAAAKSNPHPQDGKQYVLVNLTLSYGGHGARGVFSAYSLSAVGRFGLVYTALDDGCIGVVPKALDDFQRVKAGTRVTGNICYEVLSDDASVLRLRHRLSPKSPALFFKLH